MTADKWIRLEDVTYMAREVREKAEAVAKAELQRVQGKLDVLSGHVEHYLDHPGCSNPSRATAMRRLRWALDRSAEESDG